MNSTLALFEAIADAGKINRSELSRLTGFSLMTVGKAVERLTSIGIISEEKISSGSVGRKFGVCSLSDTAGIMLIDIDREIKAYALDISLNVMSERIGEDIPTLMTQCLADLFKAGRSDIIGVAIVVPDADTVKWRNEICELLGSEPELVIERECAFAYANSRRFDYTKTAIFTHITSEGKVSGLIMQDGKQYDGAHGAAGDISSFILSADNLCERLFELCLLLDPEIVHIACDDSTICEVYENKFKLLFEKHGVVRDKRAQIVSESTSLCKGALDGAARMLREKYIFSKFPNNT